MIDLFLARCRTEGWHDGLLVEFIQGGGRLHVHLDTIHQPPDLLLGRPAAKALPRTCKCTNWRAVNNSDLCQRLPGAWIPCAEVPDLFVAVLVI